ncbi:MAG: ATP-binding protein [Balneolaceae bacterium]|nr:ATP-binding protein [Balneolaceae bacterium]
MAFNMLFQNLLSNALKYRSAEEKPIISVQVNEQAAHWHISVSDNGIGIDPEYHDQVFAIFKRLHTPEQYPGTGMGLAICKKIVEQHGGEIWVESEPGKGSTFHFTILK